MNLAGETVVLGGNLPRRHFVHHKIPHDDPVSNPGPQRWEASDYPLELWRGPEGAHYHSRLQMIQDTVHAGPVYVLRREVSA
jgi:hypothetical protein